MQNKALSGGSVTQSFSSKGENGFLIVFLRASAPLRAPLSLKAFLTQRRRGEKI